MADPLYEASFADACARLGGRDAGSTLAQVAHIQASATLVGSYEDALPIERWAAEAGPQARGDARALLAEWESAETLPGLTGPFTLTGETAETHRASCQLARAWIGED